MITKRDLILIIVLAALAGGALWVLPLFRPAPAAHAALYVRLSIDGQERDTVALTEERDLTVDQGDGIVNVLHLTPGGFIMQSSACYNQLCVYQGEVTAENMAERPLYNMIVCAPHRLVAELLTAEQIGRDNDES